MQPEKSLRMDIGELKGQLFKKVGPDRFKRYFYSLNRFINQKLSKSEFDKSCHRILGRENLPLHNQIIRAILKNACSAKTPPPSVHEAGPTNPAVPTGKSLPILEDGHTLAAGVAQNQSSVAPIWSNGIALPTSPRKVRSSCIRDRKFRDRPSPLGPNGKADSASLLSTATDDSGPKTLENGDLMDLTPCDYQRPMQPPQGLAEQPEKEDRLMLKKPVDVPGVDRAKDQTYTAGVEDGDNMEQACRLNVSRSPLLAPLGIPYCSASTGGARKSIPVTHIGDYVSCFDMAGLCDSEMLRRRMEQIAAAQGLGGVTTECANTLNNLLDVYLKRLIRSCLELVGARSTSNTSMYAVQKQQAHGKLINGLWPSNHIHMQSGGPPLEEQRVHHSVSLVDFKVAMELNPQQLGEDWPLLLEKISCRHLKNKIYEEHLDLSFYPDGLAFQLEEHAKYDFLLFKMSISVLISPLPQARRDLPIRCSSTFARSNEGFELDVCTAPFIEFVHDWEFIYWPPVNGFSRNAQWWLHLLYV
ncbi:Transcriptional adapter 1 [Bienertia sinuspersici]